MGEKKKKKKNSNKEKLGSIEALSGPSRSPVQERWKARLLAPGNDKGCATIQIDMEAAEVRQSGSAQAAPQKCSEATELMPAIFVPGRGPQITPIRGRLGAPSGPVRAALGRDGLEVGIDVLGVAAPRAAAKIADVGDDASVFGVEAALAVDGAVGGALVLELGHGRLGVGLAQSVSWALDGIVESRRDSARRAPRGWGLSGGELGHLVLG